MLDSPWTAVVVSDRHHDGPQTAAALSVRRLKHTRPLRLLNSLVVGLSSDAVHQAFVGNHGVTVNLQGKLFGLTPLHLPEERGSF